MREYELLDFDTVTGITDNGFLQRTVNNVKQANHVLAEMSTGKVNGFEWYNGSGVYMGAIDTDENGQQINRADS